MKIRCIIVLFLLAGSAFAGNDPMQDLIRKAGTKSDYPDAGQLVIFDSTRVEVQESGLGYFYTHRLHKILTPDGAKELATLTYDYDPMTAWAEIRRVVIYRMDGTKEVLDTAKVLDYTAPARAIYWGASEKMIEVGRLEPGDAVEVFLFKKGFTYALLKQDDDENYIPPMKGHFYDIVPFWSDVPMLEKVYTLQLPVSKTLQYEVYNGSLKTSHTTADSVQVFVFSTTGILPIKPEPSMVAMSDVALKLLMSTSPDWQSKSTWFYGVNEDFGSFISTPEINAKVSEILKGAVNEIDSISRLTHWCADEIRYSGISMGKGEGFTLHTGDMTFTDRCGVCKDKAGMLITMLRAAGFESYPAMTMAGSRIDAIPADQFNHCVTVVKRRDGQYQLLDPTWVPFMRELWSSAEQQQNYLMGVPQGAPLMETIISPPAFHYLRIEGHSEIINDGSVQGGFIITAEGQSDAAIRRNFTGNYRARWSAYLEKELLKLSPMAHVLFMDFGNPYEYQKGPIRIELHYYLPHYATVTPTNIFITPVTASHLFKNVQSHLGISTTPVERKFPFRDRCSREVEITETITLPSSCQFVYRPEPEAVTDHSVSYQGSYSLDGTTLTHHQKIGLGKRVYQPSDWPAFRKAILNQNAMASKKVILSINP